MDRRAASQRPSEAEAVQSPEHNRQAQGYQQRAGYGAFHSDSGRLRVCSRIIRLHNQIAQELVRIIDRRRR